MEGYVWCLVHEIASRGIPVTVICQAADKPTSPIIKILLVEYEKRSSRWKEMVDFRRSVRAKCEQSFDMTEVVIHSHERSVLHNVTSFHGELFGQNFLKRIFEPLSLRCMTWRKLEYDELSAPTLKWILPVSERIKVKLLDTYSFLSESSVVVAYPGVAHQPGGLLVRKLQGYRCIFVGREWKRKGLDIAVKVIADARAVKPNITLDVYGVDATSLPRSITKFPWVKVKGWASEISWENYDLLIHLARREPFGMVIAEARAAGLPVLVSSDVGASEIGLSDVVITTPKDAREDLVRKLLGCLDLKQSRREVKWSWSDLATMVLTKIYPFA